jgi:hypothetical protein
VTSEIGVEVAGSREIAEPSSGRAHVKPIDAERASLIA